MAKFEHLNAPYSFKRFYSAYPEGYSIYEALLDWLNQVNEMVDVMNTTQSEWDIVKLTLLEEVKQFSMDQLQTWLDDGTLEGIINDALFNSKADKSELDILESQLAKTEQQISGFVNLEQFPILTDEVDDTGRFKRAIQYAQENKVVLQLAGKTYTISEEIKITGILKIVGNRDTVLYFTHSTGYALVLDGGNFIFNTFTVRGNKLINGLALNPTNDQGKSVVDSHFENLRFETFNIGVKTLWSWDNYFNSCRFHNVTKIGDFANQSNMLTFNNCRFSSYTNGFNFENCQLIMFNECDIVGYTASPANEVVQFLFQSLVSFNNCYIEHVNKFGTIGDYGEQSRSSLNINGGIILGSQNMLEIEIRSRHESRINIRGVDYNGVKLYKSGSLTHPPILIHSFIDNDDYSLRKNYNGDVDATNIFTKISGGGSLTTAVNNGYATLDVGAYNGLVIDNTLIAGDTYTFAIRYRCEEVAFVILDTSGDPSFLPSTSEWKTLYSPFVCGTTKFQLQNFESVTRTIDVQFIKLFNGVKVGGL